MFRLRVFITAVTLGLLHGFKIVLGRQIERMRLRRRRPVRHDNQTTVADALPLFRNDELVLDFARYLNEYNDVSMSMSNNLRPDRCLLSSVGPFQTENDQEIGDVLFDYGGRARSCAKESCYRVQDNGDDPPYDPDAGDTLRFAYKTVLSNRFSFQAKVCGIGGDDDGAESCDPSTWETHGRCGRIGLNIRESLDPFARNVFVLFEPYSEVGLIYRQTNDGAPYIHEFDGSPDEDACFWITVERNGDTFAFDHAYANGGSVDEYYDIQRCEKGPSIDSAFFRTLIIEDMPTAVLVGLECLLLYRFPTTVRNIIAVTPRQSLSISN